MSGLCNSKNSGILSSYESLLLPGRMPGIFFGGRHAETISRKSDLYDGGSAEPPH